MKEEEKMKMREAERKWNELREGKDVVVLGIIRGALLNVASAH